MSHTWFGKGFHIWHNGIMAENDVIEIIDTELGNIVYKVPIAELIRFLDEEYYPHNPKKEMVHVIEPRPHDYWSAYRDGYTAATEVANKRIASILSCSTDIKIIIEKPKEEEK